MSEGKFSNPRPHRDEERQIEEAFRQVTGQAPGPQQINPVLPDEDPQILKPVQKVMDPPAPTVPSQPPVKNRKKGFH